jgi:hypothetical protein
MLDLGAIRAAAAARLMANPANWLIAATPEAPPVSQLATLATLAEAEAAQAEDDREWFEERAGILEFDGGMTRAQAEAVAAELLARFRAGGAA